MLASFILQEIIHISIEKVTLYIRNTSVECLGQSPNIRILIQKEKI